MNNSKISQYFVDKLYTINKNNMSQYNDNEQRKQLQLSQQKHAKNQNMLANSDTFKQKLSNVVFMDSSINKHTNQQQCNSFKQKIKENLNEVQQQMKQINEYVKQNTNILNTKYQLLEQAFFHFFLSQNANQTGVNILLNPQYINGNDQTNNNTQCQSLQLMKQQVTHLQNLRFDQQQNYLDKVQYDQHYYTKSLLSYQLQAKKQQVSQLKQFKSNVEYFKNQLNQSIETLYFKHFKNININNIIKNNRQNIQIYQNSLKMQSNLHNIIIQIKLHFMIKQNKSQLIMQQNYLYQLQQQKLQNYIRVMEKKYCYILNKQQQQSQNKENNLNNQFISTVQKYDQLLQQSTACLNEVDQQCKQNEINGLNQSKFSDYVTQTQNTQKYNTLQQKYDQLLNEYNLLKQENKKYGSDLTAKQIYQIVNENQQLKTNIKQLENEKNDISNSNLSNPPNILQNSCIDTSQEFSLVKQHLKRLFVNLNIIQDQENLSSQQIIEILSKMNALQ